ncbi:MAG: ATP-binding protein, partial [Atopobiaceae bacterium]|nr:ATP-binding protein [Atopobiaceae bacterium]
MFVGRQEELRRLERAYGTGTFQMVVVYGRRRVGKTTLISEFARNKRALFFTALEQADADNLADFTRALVEFFGLPGGVRFDSWRDALDYLCERATQERFVFVFDEFPYAAKRNGSLPSLLQVCIDHRLQATGAFVILCGSNQGFMESEVLGRKSPLYGRRTLQMKLGPLGYRDAAQMVPWATPDEAFRIYGCVGGVPYYLAQVRERRSLRENLRELYFDPAGFLYGEPGMLLRQELSEPAAYNSVLRAVAGGATRPKEIAERTKIERNSLAGYLTTLVSLGILERAVPFGESMERSKRGIYRIREAAFAFWYRFV